ncbi:MAG: efflux RND transporter periplasmic adaptor subunit [Cyanobacteria bacterium]|nr:efflux RND transporter periplasmic adaptor subunit [Cyanobacteriota bacterium]
MKRSAAVIGVVLVIAGAAGAYWGRGLLTARGTPVEERSFVTPELRTMAATVSATGIVRLRVGAEVRVGSQVSGIVQTLNVTVGSHIQRGDVIAEIDARNLQARLAQAHAQVSVSEQDVKRAEVALARARRLDEQQLIPRQEVEDLVLGLEEAQAKLEKVRRDSAVVETELSYAVIRAPISGTVASVSTQEGETVAASFTAPTFVTIIGDNALQLIAMVDETDIGHVASGHAVTFTVEAYPAREFTGHVERIAPKATIVSGVVNYEVMIAIDDPANLLKPDMTANISIRAAERQALVIPSGAVQREADERFVYVDQAGTLTKRLVTIGTREGGVTEIKKGLDAGDRVLIGPAPGSSGKG